MIDVTDSILAAYDAGVAEGTTDEGDTPIIPSTSPVAAITFAKLATYRSRAIASKPQGFDDLDEALNFQALVACLANYVDDSVEQSPKPPDRPDRELHRLYYRKLMHVLNLPASLRQEPDVADVLRQREGYFPRTTCQKATVLGTPRA